MPRIHNTQSFFSFAAVLFLISGCSISDIYIREGFPTAVPSAPDDSIRHSLFLIGDAGEPADDGSDAVLRILTRTASRHPAKNTVIFLGDNIYPKGLPMLDHADRKEMERRIDEQIAVGAESGAAAIFIPGNHDWDYQGMNGYAAILREEEYIRSRNHPNVTLLPKNGSPGPQAVDVSESLRMIAIDTQWWLHRFEKPLYPGDSSEAQTRRRWLDSLSSFLKTPDGRTMIVAAHHPLRSHGEHGGFFDWKDHLFPLRKLSRWLWIPLPVIGSLYPLSRIWGISDQDLSGSGNIVLRSAVDSVMSLHPKTFYVSGHEHTLQVLKDANGRYYLVSGNGIAKHDEALTFGDDTILASREKGYLRLDQWNNGRVRLAVIVAGRSGGAEGREVFSVMLR